MQTVFLYLSFLSSVVRGFVPLSAEKLNLKCSFFSCEKKLILHASSGLGNGFEEDGGYKNVEEPMFSGSYDPLAPPNQETFERDLEDFLIERAGKYQGASYRGQPREECYIVGLEDKSLGERSEAILFSMEESLTELSELAGAAGLSVVGSTFQRVQSPNIEYYIGPGKVKEIKLAMERLRCQCLIFDTELSPSQQKNLERAFNQENYKKSKAIKVIDRTALILGTPSFTRFE